MTDITYDTAVTPVAAAAQNAKRKSAWRQILDAMMDARLRQAERIVKEYRDLNAQL